MSFWNDFAEGFVPAYQAGLERKHKEKLLNEQRAMDLAKSLPELRKRNQERTATATRIANASARLVRLGADQEAINRLQATGDVDGLESLVESLDKTVAGYREQNRPIPQDIISATINSAVLSPATTQEIDLTGIPSQVRDTLIDMGYTQDDLTYMAPGKISYDTPVVVEQPKLEDMERLEKRVVSAAVNRARQELATISEVQGSLNEMIIGNQEGVDTDTIKEDLAILSRRAAQITGAIEAAGNAENPVYVDVFKLYGSSYMEDLLQQFPQYRDAPFNPAMAENLNQNVISIPTMEQAERLIVDYRAFPPNTVVYVEDKGETFTVPE